MSKFEIGDLVVLTAGSMRMAVEGGEDGSVSCVWCHEGKIGRDVFDERLLKKWEHREDDHRPARHDGPRPPRAEGGRFAPRDKGGDRPGGDRDDKPRGKPGCDGKPREKKFFRKD
jgi:uncharacterized protein YodC (DUF2158 family)